MQYEELDAIIKLSYLTQLETWKATKNQKNQDGEGKKPFLFLILSRLPNMYIQLILWA